MGVACFGDITLELALHEIVAPIALYPIQIQLRNQEKGILAKGVSAESSVTPKKPNNTQGHWAQRYILH